MTGDNCRHRPATLCEEKLASREPSRHGSAAAAAAAENDSQPPSAVNNNKNSMVDKKSSDQKTTMTKPQCNTMDQFYQTTRSDEAVADALSCSLADIADTMREQKHQQRYNQYSLHQNMTPTTTPAVSESATTTRTETSSSDPEQNASIGAVTGSTTTAESRHAEVHHHHHSHKNDESTGGSFTASARWPEAAAQSHRQHRQARARRTMSRDAGFEAVASMAPAHYPPQAMAGHHDSRDEPSADHADSGREPGLYTIRQQMNRISLSRRREHNECQASNKPHYKRSKAVVFTTSGAVTEQSQQEFAVAATKPLSKKQQLQQSAFAGGGDNASSSGSGTEGGYAGSASANDNDNNGSSSSSDDSRRKKNKNTRHCTTTRKAASESTSDPMRPMLLATIKQDSGVSSDLADFGSSASENEMTESFGEAFAPSPSSSRSPSISSGSHEETLMDQQTNWPPVPLRVSDTHYQNLDDSKLGTSTPGLMAGKSPLLSVGCDIMAHVLTFLEPPNIHEVLTMPLSKDWLFGYTRQPELWRVLCLLEPFKAQVDSNGNDSSDDSDFSGNVESELRVTFGKHRLLYTSFVRCMKYLTRIKDDAVNGRPPSVIDYGSGPATFKNIETNHNLKEFLARARGITIPNERISEGVLVDGMGKLIHRRSKMSRKAHKSTEDGDDDDDECDHGGGRKRRRSESDKNKCTKKKKKITYGHSILTQRMLGPTMDGTAGTAVELPWSCAIYSIVNWMVAFSDVEGIQTMCMKVLPSLLDDEQQRITAQRAGLTDIIFRAMVMFPDNSDLHTAACHTIVLLARPLGGREGMLFHTSMVNSSGIFSNENGGAESGRNGIAVLLDSMRRFRDNEALQAMSCWSLVNVALAPAQKEMLVRLGAIEVTAAAMQTHPFNAEVQFRALFALVNLVIPSVSLNQDEGSDQRDTSSAEDSSERDVLDENVSMIVQLVVQSMKNFCASEAILNRACLVLHNLSLTQDYHSDLLWTPNCYQMLEWCLANYPSDQVLQQSAAGTLHRLQITLSGDENLRTRFMASLQSQQQLSLEQAHREAGALHNTVSAAAATAP